MKVLYSLVLQHIEIIKVSFIIIAGSFAVFQYWSSNKFKQAQYLRELWRKFYETEVLTKIFQALEGKDENAFKNIEKSDIYLYLAFLEEIVIYRKRNFFEFHKIDSNSLLDLFQFHFYWVYQCNETKKIFWGKILEVEEIENEINNYYWKNQLDFSKLRKNKIADALRKLSIDDK